MLPFRISCFLKLFTVFRNNAELFVTTTDKQMNKQWASKLDLRVMRDSVFCHHTHEICISGILKFVGSRKPARLVWWQALWVCGQLQSAPPAI
jgi:hypothetical protein